jgi:hypothetical protein
MKKTIAIITICILTSCTEKIEKSISEISKPISIKSEKIKVLNFATFHMGSTTDATHVKFDEEDKKNQEDAKKIAQMISKFKPTIICVEVPLNDQTELNAEYQKYVSTPKNTSSYYGEVGLVAFEVGRICKVARLYGIDHKMNYNYMIGSEIVNSIDSITLKNYYADPFKSTPELNVNEDELSLVEKLKLNNSSKYLDFLITVNADMLAFAGTETGFEGADEAAKYYQRNLRIYSNLNRIPATKEDRIFILSGGSHTAFLREFMERSPKYEVVNTFEYLK